MRHFESHEIAIVLRDKGVDPDQAYEAAKRIAESWNEDGPFYHYQGTKDILGDYLDDDQPRPKYLADDLADAFGITYEDD